MSDVPRSKTTSIPRPAGVKASDEGRSRLGDFTRPIPVEKRISRRPKVAAFTGVFALCVVASIAFAVFVLPISTWRDQDVDIEQRQAQLDELLRVNGELASETSRLDINLDSRSREHLATDPTCRKRKRLVSGHSCHDVSQRSGARAAEPRYAAASPRFASMRSSWLYLATRSERHGAPVLIWPQLVATARSAIGRASCRERV